MDKELVYNNICSLINNGFFLEKYMEITKNIELENNEEILEKRAASLFNSIVIGCQLFDDESIIKKFIDFTIYSLDSYSIETFFNIFKIDESVALDRLKHGFGLHFTTPKIAEEIMKCGQLTAYGNNSMFTKEEDEIIANATSEQKKRNPDAERTMRYLFRGWGTGVSSYGSKTNGFWMYHTPESLSFLFGDISKRDKKSSMEYVLSCISSLDEETKKKTFETMSSIWDRLIGDEQNTCCILIDRDAFEYEVDYYYHTGEPVPVERRPYRESFNDIEYNDSKINTNINISNLRFIKVPTVIQLEYLKQQKLSNKQM